MSNHETDVLIIGGGPAGLAAAVAVRRRGLSALVIDHDKPPIDKACGEGLMPDSLAALAELGITLDSVQTGQFSGIRFLRNDCIVEARFPHGQGRGIRRVLLHELLLAEAERAGAEFAWSTRVEDVQQHCAQIGGSEVRFRWIVGADGNNSRIRKRFGLEAGENRGRRSALRQHFRVQRWSDFVEIFWSHSGQAYVTPIGESEVCVALISRAGFASFADGLSKFPEVTARLASAIPSTTVRGAVTWSRRLQRVTARNIALIGEASGSVDAITGEGLNLAFRQAAALGDALAAGDLRLYARAHRKIMRLPEFMSSSMLLMDKSAVLQRQAFRAFEKHAGLFARMLAIHIGEKPLTIVGGNGVFGMGWKLLWA